jgi:DNA-binding Lrp family transcriptional regulator
MDDIDRRIVNDLQGDLPLTERPYAAAAERLGIGDRELIDRLEKLLADGVLSRFGPMFHAERMGGALTLAALAAPEDRFDAVAGIVNAFPEVAHNYARDHALNMWFVVATDRPERVTEVLAEIEWRTGLTVYNMPKLEEFFVGLRFAA